LRGGAIWDARMGMEKGETVNMKKYYKKYIIGLQLEV
jgi:hypothetical protein